MERGNYGRVDYAEVVDAMIPILFNPNEENFTTQGIGSLTDVISCTVEEERNGIYEMELEYPITGIHYAEIQKRCIVYAIPSPYRDPQPFRIYKITRPLDGVVTVYASHISYDLNGIPVHPFKATSIATALQGLEDNAAIENPFTFWTDKSTAGNFSVSVPTACRSCLGGQQGSILDTYGGEFLWDKFQVWLYNERGQESGVTIRYRKNLTDINHQEDVGNTVTGIYPYWADTEGNLVTCSPPIIYAEGNFGYQKAVPVDFSQEFQEAPTPAELKEAAESYIERNEIGKPDVSISVSFVLLSQMSGYEDLEILEKCDLCDTVTVQYEELGVDAAAKIVGIKTNVLTERYESMQVGSIRANVAQQIADQQKELQEKPTTTQMQQAISHTTELITGNQGGYVILRLNEIGQPYEILVMDTTDIQTAQNVWRWNQQGWGHSNNGYNGPYDLGATMDGAIVATLITVGTMLFDRLKGGMLTLGGSGNGNGRLEMRDASDVLIGYIDNTGIDFERGEIKGVRILSYASSQYEEELQIEDGTVGFYYADDEGNRNRLAYIGAAYVLSTEPGSAGAISISAAIIGMDLLDGNGSVNNEIFRADENEIRMESVINIDDAIDQSTIRNVMDMSKDGVEISVPLSVTGEKSRLVNTKSYGNRLQYCYETATPYFGDIGIGTINEDGECYVSIDSIFSETVENNVEYVVFLQAEGKGEIWAESKEPDFFIVKGTPGLKFAWEIKAMQKDYSQHRLDDFDLGRSFNIPLEKNLEKISGEMLAEYDRNIKALEESYTENIAEYDEEVEEMNL